MRLALTLVLGGVGLAAWRRDAGDGSRRPYAGKDPTADASSQSASDTDKDPRGPLRTVVSVELTKSGNLTRFAECNHAAALNPTMAAAKPGEQVRCFECGPYGGDCA